MTDLLAKATALDPSLGAELSQRYKDLVRPGFGLVFEHHLPESVALPTKTIVRGDTVAREGDDGTLWTVKAVKRRAKTADLVRQEGSGEDVVIVTDDAVPLDELTAHVRLGSPFYPGLREDSYVSGGDPDAPTHTVITAENAHALQLLGYTHREAVDCIYIDPPYNTGARDWKYNNDYVEGTDHYRHSKWLSFMERRLNLVKPLIAENGVLIVTIDEKEVHRLALLLDQVFPEARIQMVSSVISPQAAARAQAFGRTDEYLFFVMFGNAAPAALPLGDDWIETKTTVKGRLHWSGLARTGTGAQREDSPNLFFPVFARNTLDGPVIVSVGEPYFGTDRNEVEPPEGCVAVWPIRSDNSEGRWQASPVSLTRMVGRGFVRLGRWRGEQTSISYLKRGEQKKVEEGLFPITGYAHDGSIIVDETQYVPRFVPGTQWRIPSHDASRNGSNLLRALMPDRRFPFPKSLYAVEDALRFFVADKPDAMILDAFGGSGTTAHAVMRLNAEDGGRRTATLLTNNEVGADEAKVLRAKGLRPGDAEWEAMGIADYITKPRVTAAITGRTPAGDPIKGDYRYNRVAPIADGHAQNLRCLTLTYESHTAVRNNLAAQRIAAVLWLAGGQRGPVLPLDAEQGYAISDAYAVLYSMDASAAFLREVVERDTPLVYIVTDELSAFTALSGHLPGRTTVRLYEDYLANFAAHIEGE